MLNLLGELAARLGGADDGTSAEAGAQACAVATIIGAGGSVPRAVGTSMLVTESGKVTGSLSGGCVEGAVYEACQEALATGQPAVEQFGFSDDDALAVGLPCGGTLEVLIQPFYPHGDVRRVSGSSGSPGFAGPDPADPASDVRRWAGAVVASSGAALIRRVDNDVVSGCVIPEARGTDDAEISAALLPLLRDASVVRSATAQVAALLTGGQTGVVRLAPGKTDRGDRPVTLLVETRPSPARLFLFGANDFSAALSDAARLAGYSVILCDARPVFATRAGFPRVDELIVERPDRYLARAVKEGLVDRRSVICVLTHDEKFDVPVLRLALELDVAYIGAMGSRPSSDRRLAALQERGVGPELLAKLHSPIGLDIGAVTPAEVAVSILAEIVAVSHGRTATLPLSFAEGPIHGEAQLQTYPAREV